MNKRLKKIMVWFFVLLLVVYGGYRLYNYILEDVTRRIQASVAAGASQGVSEAVNPLNWPKKLFGFGHKKKVDKEKTDMDSSQDQENK